MSKIISILAVLVAIAAAGLVVFDDQPTRQTAYEPSSGSPTPSRAGKALTIGSISDDPMEEVPLFQPIADYLASALESGGYSRGEVLVCRNLEEMADKLRSGEVDIYIDSPFPITFVYETAGALPLVRRWKKGVGEYHAVVFSSTNSGIRTVQDLVGKRMAFSERYSTSAYLLPKASLLEAGLRFRETSLQNPPVDDAVNYVFSDDDEASMIWVLSGKVQAAALSEKDFNELSGSHGSKLRVLHTTRSVPRHVVCVRAQLPVEDRRSLRSALVAMNQDSAAAKILKDFSRTSKFDLFPGGTEHYFAPIQEMAKLVFQDLAK